MYFQGGTVYCNTFFVFGACVHDSGQDHAFLPMVKKSSLDSTTEQILISL